MENYQVISKMADALYGSILLAIHRQTKTFVVIKQMQIQRATAQLTNNFNDTFLHIEENAFFERQVNRWLSRPNRQISANVVELYDSFDTRQHMHLVFEYCAKGELFDAVTARQLTSAQNQQIFADIVHGLHYIHSNGFAHRDLSLENVLLTQDNRAKICDFGLAASKSAICERVVGKLYYMAPEIYKNAIQQQQTRYDPVQADLWSLGVMLFMMLTGVPPVDKACESDDRFQLIKEQGVVALLTHWGMLDKIPTGAVQLLSKLLVVNPQERISVSQLLQHSWVRSVSYLSGSRRRKVHKEKPINKFEDKLRLFLETVSVSSKIVSASARKCAKLSLFMKRKTCFREGSDLKKQVVL